MAWIRTVDPSEAEGPLKRQYEQAVRRAGKLFHIVRLSSLNPELNQAFLDVYLRLMHGPSDLTRRQRELLATVVSAVNRCHY